MAIIPMEYEYLMTFLWKMDVINPYEIGYRTVAMIDGNGNSTPAAPPCNDDFFIVYPGISDGK